MKNKNAAPALSDGLRSFISSLICIFIGLFIGLAVLIVLSWITYSQTEGAGPGRILKSAWESGFKQILMGGFYMKPIGVGKQIAEAAPLIMTGLSVGFAFKTGLFNIGVAGQYT
ncbi:MAG: hypothetical protein FWG32_08830, partial [Oscillospiraceae bacterium]|nr:hypothetical protein [Oscillospiraceae bacterium]